MATEANLICYRGRTGVRERSEEVLFIHSLPRKVSSNEERSDGRRQRIARSFGPRKSAPFLPRYSSPQLRLRWCRHAAGRLLELRGTGGRAEAAASNINYDARSLALPLSLFPSPDSSLLFSNFLSFPTTAAATPSPLPSFLPPLLPFTRRLRRRCTYARCGGRAVGGAPSSILLPFLPFLP